MREIGCVLCSHSESRPVIEDNGFTGRQCAGCGLIFVSPRPTREEIAEVYEEGEAYLSPEEFVKGPESLSGRARASEDVRRIKRHVTGGALLEIGPGRGTFLAAARRGGFDVHGVELNPVQAEFIARHYGIPCVSSLDQAEGLSDGGFDVVYHRDVLSHFYDPHEEMGRLRALLRPGGLHIFETGNLADVDHRHLALIRSFQYPDHLFFYGDRSLRLLLDQTGFELVHLYRYSILPERWLRARLTGLVRSGGGAGERAAPPGPPPAGSGARATAAMAARQALDLLYYGLHLTVGAMPAAADVPQTLIVVARKR